MKYKGSLATLCSLVLLSNVGSGAVTVPPEEVIRTFRLSPFYKKSLLVEGLPIVASEKVSDFALEEAAYLIRQMLAHRPELLPVMAKNKVRFSIMAWNEFTTDIPEHSDLKPKDYMDRRARGLGATRARPSVSCGEENLLCYPGDPYSAENILIHEFGHAIHEMGMSTVDGTFDQRLRDAYEAAMKEGLWKTKYAARNHHEYWAEGVQSWFDTNRVNDHDHNHVHTRAQLKDYDPRLAKLVEEVFGDLPWRYKRPMERSPSEKIHLAGYQPEKAPRFSWPERLMAVDLRGGDNPESPDRVLSLLAAEEPTPASRPSAETSVIVFENKTAMELELFWLDWEKKRKSYGRIRPGAILRMETFVGHAFELCTSEGKRVAAVVADNKPAKAVIQDR